MNEERHTIQAKVFRYNPIVDQVPRYEVYVIPYTEGLSVSTVLQYINEEYDGGLAHYISCRRGICTECMVRVNGKVILGCMEIVQGDITIEPIKRDHVIKDLLIKSRMELNQE